MDDILSLKRERRMILLVTAAVTLLGLLMVYEASCIYAYRASGDPAYYLKRQLVFLAVGLALFSGALVVDIDGLRRHNRKILVASIVVLLAVVLAGHAAGGAKRWLSLGSFNVQPSEFLKITFLLYAVDYVTRKGVLIKDFRSGIMPLLLVLSLVFGLLIVQPDMGSAMFWVLWTLVLLFIYRARPRHLAGIVVVGLVLAVVLIKTHPYRFRRITGFMNPFADPQGAGFQLIQSQVAYGQGGMLGVGLGESRQKLFFLPASHTDFIFSIIAEEFGLIGVTMVLAAFYFLLNRMCRLARRIEDDYRRGLLWGIILIFSLEIFVNVGVSCGLLPTKGLSLPFISYGGSNLAAHFALLGLFFNASKLDTQTNENPSGL